jgi:hypothetical protein
VAGTRRATEVLSLLLRDPICQSQLSGIWPALRSPGSTRYASPIVALRGAWRDSSTDAKWVPRSVVLATLSVLDLPPGSSTPQARRQAVRSLSEEDKKMPDIEAVAASLFDFARAAKLRSGLIGTQVQIGVGLSTKTQSSRAPPAESGRCQTSEATRPIGSAIA